jgi:hypothetical protein
MPDQVGNVGQRRGIGHGFLYAASSIGRDKFVATFHGNSSSICLMG